MIVTPRRGAVPDTTEQIFLTSDPRMTLLLARIERAARLDLPILIEGESGTGKDLIARLVHGWSGREREPFVPANVAALPDELFESIVFGHARGSFTGAVESRPGLAAAAGRGTLFLDEIGELPSAAQAKLLRFIDRREYIPLGETKPRRFEGRIVAATNRSLAADCAAGRFRHDLYYRLSPLVFNIPPLRERRADIEPLARAFLAEMESAHGLGPFRLHETALEALQRHAWPGNVRELESEMLRAALAARGCIIRVSHLSPALASVATHGASVAAESASPAGSTLAARVAAFERAEIVDALRASGGNRAEAARILGMKRTTLIGAMRRLDVER